MKVAIMQPYFLPYLGYYQLANTADVFVIYDNLKYTKKGWINRNRYLTGGKINNFSLPLEKDSDFALISSRKISNDFDAHKTLNRIFEAYRKSPFLSETMPLLSSVLLYQDKGLFNFIKNSISLMFDHLGITTRILTASDIPIDHDLRGEEKVIAICKELGADVYINPPGGVELYEHKNFLSEGIELQFINPALHPYPQHCTEFLPALSVIDPLMQIGREGVKSSHLVPAGFF